MAQTRDDEWVIMEPMWGEALFTAGVVRFASEVRNVPSVDVAHATGEKIEEKGEYCSAVEETTDDAKAIVARDVVNESSPRNENGGEMDDDNVEDDKFDKFDWEAHEWDDVRVGWRVRACDKSRDRYKILRSGRRPMRPTTKRDVRKRRDKVRRQQMMDKNTDNS